MERYVYKHIYIFFTGFTPGNSAINQLLNVTNEFAKALGEGKQIRVVFCDIRKPFERVWHKGLLNKLENIGIQGSYNCYWIKHYLTDRKQRVVIESAHSKWRTIKVIMLNNDMAIHAWSTKWLVNFNPKKTETTTITRKINKHVYPPLIMNNTIINKVTEHKHLGLEISNDGSWQKHIDLITKKAFTRVNILRKFKFIPDRKTLEKIYLTDFGICRRRMG